MEQALDAAPEVPLLRWEHELPEPCVVHPEQVDTYPWAEDDTLPDRPGTPAPVGALLTRLRGDGSGRRAPLRATVARHEL